MGLFCRKYSPFRIAIGLLVCAGAGVSEADGAVFTVNSTVDAVDAAPGDGVCATGANVCTLRAAVMETNALPGLDTIFLSFFSSPFTLTIPSGLPPGLEDSDASVGDLDITDDLFILPTAFAITSVIDGGDLDRIFHVHPRAVVAIGGVTIRNGNVGQDRTGGAVRNEGLLTLISASVESSRARLGGGIGSPGPLTLLNTVVSGNRSLLGGGGIASGASTLVVTNSAVRDNVTNGLGGGILSNGLIELTASTVSGNAVRPVRGIPAGGGGISNGDHAVLTNSTISGNSSPDGAGIAGIGTLDANSSTIAANQGEGLRTINPHQLVNTIVANNTGPDCFLNLSTIGVVSLGHNLDSDGSCNLSQASDLSGVNPLLGPLADNGGLTLTHALLGGSPAIDAGGNADCPTTDQRGVARPQGPTCDIGSYELNFRRSVRE